VKFFPIIRRRVRFISKRGPYLVSENQLESVGSNTILTSCWVIIRTQHPSIRSIVNNKKQIAKVVSECTKHFFSQNDSPNRWCTTMLRLSRILQISSVLIFCKIRWRANVSLQCIFAYIYNYTRSPYIIY
jgi:hypothetical protein